MTTINRLTRVPSLDDGDVVPIYDASDSRTRAVSVGVIRQYLADTISHDVEISTARIDGGHLIFTTNDGKEVDAGVLPDSLTGQEIKQKLESLPEEDKLSTDDLQEGVKKLITADQLNKIASSFQPSPNGHEQGKLAKFGFNNTLESGPQIGSGPNQIPTLNSDGKYPASLISGLPSGGGSGTGMPIDTGSLTNNALIKWDSTTGQFVSAKVFSNEDGSLSLSPSSMDLGANTLSSNGDGIIITSKTVDTVKAPLFQEVGEDKGTGYVRVYADVRKYTINRNTNQTLTNPSFSLPVPNDVTNFGIGINLNQPATNFTISLQDNNDNGKVIWQHHAGNLSAGAQTIMFENPADYKKGGYYTVNFFSSDGSDVICNGGLGVNSKVMPTFYSYATNFTDKALATEEYVNGLKLVNAMSISGDKLTATFQDGTNTVLTIPSAGSVAGIQSKVTANESAINKLNTDSVANAKSASDNKDAIDAVKVVADKAANDIEGLSATFPNDIAITGNKGTKKLTVKLLRDGTVINSGTYNLSSWFEPAGTPSPTEHTIYYGFSPTDPNPDGVKQFQHSDDVTTDNLDGYKINITRSGQTSEHFYIWMPDSLGEIDGFASSGFTDKMAFTALTIDAVAGKLFKSANPTASDDVQYKVKV